MSTSHDPFSIGLSRYSKSHLRGVKTSFYRWLLGSLSLISLAVGPALAATSDEIRHSIGPVMPLGGEAGFATKRNTFPLQPDLPAPRSCSIGFYVDDLYNFSPTTDSFDARIWVWSVCPDSSRNPLDTLEFTNANTTTTNQKTSTIQSNGVQYSNMQLTGKFRHQFNVRRYPFDQQLLQIVVENGTEPVEYEIFTADDAESRCAPNMGQDGLSVRSCRVKSGLSRYATSFGEPGEIDSNGSTYSEVTVEIEMTRNGTLGLFFKSMSVYFASFLMALFTLVMFKKNEWATPDRLGVLGTLGVGLFSTALWMSYQTSVLNSASQFTLLDAQGILTLVAIVFAASIVAWDGARSGHGKDNASVPVEGYRYALILAIGYVTLSAVLAALAAS